MSINPCLNRKLNSLSRGKTPVPSERTKKMIEAIKTCGINTARIVPVVSGSARTMHDFVSTTKKHKWIKSTANAFM